MNILPSPPSPPPPPPPPPPPLPLTKPPFTSSTLTTQSFEEEAEVGAQSCPKHSHRKSYASTASSSRPTSTSGRGQAEAQLHDDAPLDVGGPEDLSLLKSFRTHMAKAILEGEGRSTLRLHQHLGLLGSWVVKEDRFKQKVMNSGLLPLCSINNYSQCNSFIISAFVERWYPETNTFHFEFGEMWLTLNDIEQLLGIPVRGLVVYTKDERMPKELLMDLLGVTAEVVKNALKGNSVKLSWLEMNFKEVNEMDTDERVACCAQAYLLYVIGCTLFCDKSGGFIQVDLFPLLEDFDQVRTHGWGSSCLAFFYGHLGYASRRKTKQLGGFLILLESTRKSFHGHDVGVCITRVALV